MKNVLLLLITVSLMGLSSCNKSKSDSKDVASVDSDEWKEMDSFHIIMADAFHPYKDSANLAPVKKLAEEMAVEANKWAFSPLPERVNNDDVKQSLYKLKEDTRALADLIKSGADDSSVGASLNSLHDSFHGIMEAWHKGEEKNEHSH